MEGLHFFRGLVPAARQHSNNVLNAKWHARLVTLAGGRESLRKRRRKMDRRSGGYEAAYIRTYVHTICTLTAEIAY